jgi:hypothetical protein
LETEAGARAAYQLAIDSGHPTQAPWAAVNLGLMLEKQGDIEGVRAAFQRAVNFGEPEAVEIATANLDRLGG